MTSEREIVALTDAAAAAFHAYGLTREQLAANRRIVRISGSVCAEACGSPDRHFAGAFVAGRLAGFVVSTRHAADDLELDWLMVHPEHHGSGVANLLMEEGMAWLGRRHPIWLNVIRHNHRAIAFYRRFGFEIDPSATTEHIIPHWIMRRPPDSVSGSS